MEKNRASLIHDLNSSLGTLQQSLSMLMDENNHEVCSQLHPLCLEKMNKILSDWEIIKKILTSGE